MSCSLQVSLGELAGGGNELISTERAPGKVFFMPSVINYFKCRCAVCTITACPKFFFFFFAENIAEKSNPKATSYCFGALHSYANAEAQLARHDFLL